MTEEFDPDKIRVETTSNRMKFIRRSTLAERRNNLMAVKYGGVSNPRPLVETQNLARNENKSSSA